MSSASLVPPVKQGMLFKRAIGKSSFGKKNSWNNRYFVLTPSKLSYYDKYGGEANNGSLKGFIEVGKIKAAEDVQQGAFEGHQFLFQIAYDEYVLYCEATSVEEKNNWLENIRSQISSNPILTQTYHPGYYDGKWTCCSSSQKNLEGCTTCFDYSALRAGAKKTSSDPTSASSPPKPSRDTKPRSYTGPEQPMHNSMPSTPGFLNEQNSQSSLDLPSQGSRTNMPLPPPPGLQASTLKTPSQSSLTSSQPQPTSRSQMPLPAPPSSNNTSPPKHVPTSTPSSNTTPTPPRPPKAKSLPLEKQAVVLYTFRPQQDTDLPLTKGERVTILDDSSSQWWRARNSSGRVGQIPFNYVRIIEEENSADASLKAQKWYKGRISRTEAVALLKALNQEGGFLVRESQSKDGEYSLSVSHGAELRHYHVKVENNEYYVSERHRFASIEKLIEYHRHNGGGLVTRLRVGVGEGKEGGGFGETEDDQWEIQPSEIRMGDVLGAGQFGVVRRGVFVKTNLPVAVKMMKEGSMTESDFLSEAAVMKNLRHKNLVQLYGVCTKAKPIFIVTEFMPCGCLLDHLRDHQELASQPEILHFMSEQVASGMAFLEHNNFIHRDLAARNCLLGEAYAVKVADFGLARGVIDDEYTASEGTKYPIKWAAPEVIQYARFSSKSDVWSFGILLWEVWTIGRNPYPSFTNMEVVEKVVEGYRLGCPQAANNTMHQIMLSCWHQDPESRPTFSELERVLKENKAEYDDVTDD